MTTILLYISIIIMFLGVITDIRTRKFPNKLLLILIILGLFHSLLNNHLIPSLIIFICINFLGLFAHEYKLLSPGDIKFVSVLMFYLNVQDAKVMACFLLITLFTCLTYGLVFPLFRYKSKEELKEHYQTEFNNLRYFIYLKSSVVETHYKDAEDLKKRTHPMTVQLFLSFICSLILCSF